MYGQHACYDTEQFRHESQGNPFIMLHIGLGYASVSITRTSCFAFITSSTAAVIASSIGFWVAGLGLPSWPTWTGSSWTALGSCWAGAECCGLPSRATGAVFSEAREGFLRAICTGVLSRFEKSGLAGTRLLAASAPAPHDAT